MRTSIVILTYNSESSIADTLRSVTLLSDDIYVVDSFSTDRTVHIAGEHGVKVIEHAFDNYGAQRNWAIRSLPLKYNWQLHLDADERLTSELRQEIMDLHEEVDVSGFFIPRMLYFLNKPIRHGGMCPTWHMRLFRSGFAKCEARKYDQHFYIVKGGTAKLKAYMIDDIRMSLSEWTSRHNRWSDAEAEEQNTGDSDGRIKGRLTGNQVERKRFWRDKYNVCPLFLRPFVLFFYRYVLRFGFMDGSTGFVFYVLQTFWFRFLIDSKMFEVKLKQKLVEKHNRNIDSAALQSVRSNSSSDT